MADKHNNIILIGPMGSGKTTIARQIAEQTSLTFFDSDQEVIQRSGVEISWIFEQEGEQGFRRREQKTLESLINKNNIVLATGGGCVTNPKIVNLLKNNGLVIYLKVSLSKQFERLSMNKSKRPLFSANNTKTQLSVLNQKREPLYQSVASLCFTTDTKTPSAIARDIITAWETLHDKT